MDQSTIHVQETKLKCLSVTSKRERVSTNPDTLSPNIEIIKEEAARVARIQANQPQLGAQKVAGERLCMSVNLGGRYS